MGALKFYDTCLAEKMKLMLCQDKSGQVMAWTLVDSH